MKRILIVLEDKSYKYLKKIKDKNKHTWEQCLYVYADTYKGKEQI